MLRLIATPPRLIMAVFFMESIGLANWLPRIPDMQDKLGLGPAELALGLMGMPVGTFIALSLVGSLIQRLTARRTIMLGSCLYCLALCLPGWAWSIESLFAALLVMGLSYPVVDVAMNVEAAAIQAAVGRRIMSTCHGFWSVGAMAGALIGAGFAQAAIDTRWHLLLIALVCFPLTFAAGRSLPKALPEAAGAARRGVPLALPTVGMIGLCLVALGAILVEMATRNWSAVYLRDVLAASPGAAGVGLGVFSLFMAAGRLIGDRLADRFGPVPLARMCYLSTLVGMGAVIAAPNVAVAFAGLAAAGFGVSVIFPLAISAAAARGDRPAAINVAALALVAYSTSLFGSPLIGFVAEAAGLRVGMGIVLPVALVGTLLVGELMRRAAPAEAGAVSGAA